MEQPTRDQEYDRIAERKKQNKKKKGYSSNKPWWLVIFIVILLAGFLFYIKWLNSPAAKEYRSFWAYLVEPKTTEVKSDPLAGPGDDLASLFGTDSTSSAGAGLNDDWAETTPPAPTPSDNGLPENKTAPPASNPAPAPPPPAASPTPSVTTETVYIINAGEFKNKGSAQFRISELRQGNYAARLLEPNSEGGTYKVVVGEYKNGSTARSVAQSMGFILEIRASVEEKK